MQKNNIFEMSKNGKSEYCVNVVKIGTLKPIEGSDFLAQTFIGDASVVVRKDQVKEGDILFYASNECQLNEKFLSVNNLFEVGCYEKNANAEEVNKLSLKIKECDEKIKTKFNTTDDSAELTEIYAERDNYKAQIKSMCGFFNHNGRVRMIRLKKTPSMGYLFSLDEMAKYCPKAKDVNMEDYLNVDFDTVDGELFVKAYMPPIRGRQNNVKNGNKRDKKLKRFDRMIEGEFSFHYDTSQLGKNMWQFNPDDIVTISNKFHGCVERNTIVTTQEFGDKTIGEIVDNKIECHIKAYDTILKQIVYVPIDNFYTVHNDGEWYELELSNGVTIKITGNNPVWCEDLQCYRRVDELDGTELLVFDKTM